LQTWWHDSRAHFALAWPLCLGQVGLQLMALVDSIMVGHYDRVALAGFGVANTLLFAMGCLGVGIVLGLDSLIPQALGRNQPAEARALYRSGLRVSLHVGLPLTALAAVSPLLMTLFGVQTEVAEEATIYLYGRLPSLLPFLFFTASSSYLQAVGRTRPIVVVAILGNILNVIADGVLVFGDDALTYVGLDPLGLPALGGLGASLSTSIVSVFMAAALGWAVAGHKVSGACNATRAFAAKIRRLGTPVGLQMLAEVGIFTIATLLAGRLGVVPASAHQIALTLATVTFSFSIGMGAATSVRVGFAVGVGDHQAARRAGLVGVSWAALVMGIAGLFFAFTPAPLARLFTSDVQLVDAAVPLLMVAALFQLSDATQAVVSGALRGAGDTRATFIGNLIGHYGLGLWISLGLAFGADMGVVGLWWGLSAGLTLTASGLAARFWWLTSRAITPT
jgi:multidrug resistance protein, MATE family